jgi:hypothetical protein
MRFLRHLSLRHVLFFTAYLLVSAALLWPVYTVAAYAEPLILGLPPSLAWLAACIAILFAALGALYRADCRTAR